MTHPAILAALLLALPCGLLRADILDLNAGLDRNNPGNWTFSLGTARDNVLSNGDTFLAQNAGHFHKAPYGATDGTTGAEGFVGIYKTAGGDTLSMDYGFIAPSAIVSQDWSVKNTIWRTTNGAFSGRLQFSILINGDPTPDFVMNSGWFGRASDGADIDLSSVIGAGTGYDGPVATYSADLSSFGIQAGDSVVYRFTLGASDALAGTTASRVGLAVQLIPEPSTFLTLAAGILLLAGLRLHLVPRCSPPEQPGRARHS